MTDIDIGYNLDTAGYLAGISAIEQANARVQQSIGSVTTTSTGLSRALGLVTPGRATIAGFTLLAQQAAQAQQNLSGLAATSAVTGTNVGKLAGGIRQMSRDMPLGSTASRQLVEQFSKIGLASAGSEAKILRLSTSVAKLSGATGEAPGQLAQGMTELARATGNTNLDPKRFEALGDSLTTISAKSGASATGILAFSKSIAPMAQASGIGATGVLGISSAFARLGEDGLGAATAVNKMLSDMNRAVREGSPEMKTYAQMAGKTTEEFSKLFKMNPAEALTQVTEAVAKAGPGGPRMLEQIGIEGVRGQRALQALAASGGLRTAISDATAGYGSGQTNKPAEAAFGGLNDSMTRLGESTEQVAEAFGAPLLGPLTAFTDGLNKATGGLAKLLGSGPGQVLLSGAGAVGVGALGLKAVAGPLGALALGRQAATSGPLLAGIAGLVAGSGMDPQGRLGRWSAGVARAEADIDPRTGRTRLRSGPLGGLRGAAYDLLYGFADQRAYRRGTGQYAEPPMLGPMTEAEARRANRPAYGARAAWSLLHETTGTYLGMTAQQLRNPTLPAMQRDPSWGFTERLRRSWQAGRTANDDGTASGTFEAMRKSATAFTDTMTESSKTIGKASKETATSLGDVGKAGLAMVKQVGADVKTAGASIAANDTAKSFLRGTAATLGLAAATGGVEWLMDKGLAQAERRDTYLQRDMSEDINAYRESIGKATDATATFGSTSMQLQKQLVASAKQSSFADVKRITDADVAAAGQGEALRKYTGSAEQIAAQIQAMAPTGVAADELQAIKTDLLKQMSKQRAQDVLDLLPAGFEAGQRQTMSTEDMSKIVTSMTGQASTAAPNPLSAIMGGGTGIMGMLFGGSPLTGGGTMGQLDISSQMPQWMRTVTGSPGGRYDISSLTDESQAMIEKMQQGIGQTFAKNAELYGEGYASQERAKQVNTALAQAVKEGNADAFQAIANAAGQELGGEKLKGAVWSPADFEAAGGKFEEVVAKFDKDTAEGLAELREQQRKAGGELKPELIEQAFTKAIRPVSAFLGEGFDVRGTSVQSRAMQRSLAQPEDVGLQMAAVDAMVVAAQAAGKSLNDLATESATAAGKVAENGDAQVRLIAIMQRAQFAQQAQNLQRGATPGEVMNQQLTGAMDMARIQVTDQFTAEQKRTGEQNTLAGLGAAEQRMKARLMVQRNYEIQAGRMEEDFERQRLYSKQDYELQVFRLERNAGIQRERAIEGFHIQAERAEEDFATQRRRILRDFAIQAQRAEEDYLKARARQIRDFNISLKRQIEDAAKSMYDPYDRIQTKATWDTQNLLVNMASQTEAMQKQKAQLDELRKMGLSAQTIDILGLGKTENAQQLNNIMADASPEAIAQLNAAARERAKAAGALYTDQSNTDLKRSREDFNKSMKDQEEDYLKSVQRSQEDLAKSLRDSQRDFDKAMRRSREDFARNLRNAREDLNLSLADMAKDRDTSMARAEKALGVQLSRMQEDIAEADKVISADMVTLAEETNKAIHGKAVDWQKIMKNDTKSWVTSFKSDVVPQLNSVWKSMGLDVKDIAAVSVTGKSSGGGTYMTGGGKPTAYGEGGSIDGWSPHPKADNVLVRATAGEFMQPVKAVNHYGPGFMEAVRSLRFPREMAAQGLAEGGMVYKQMAAWVHKNLPGVVITSAYRSPSQNAAVGGSNTSMHMQGKALDLAPSMSTFNRILGAFGSAIHQLFYSPADGRTILRGKPWRMDPSVKADHWDHVHWAMQTMAGITGMSPEQLASVIEKMPNKTAIQRALSAKVAAALQAKLAALGGGGDPSGPDYTGEDATSRWTPNVNNVLRMLGRPMAEAGAVLRRIDFESDGNPRAINNWDSNARAGTPSKGLMQVIDPTFAAYRSRSLPNNIWDPTANIYAGSHYAIRRYGSLAAIDPRNRPRGYDEGGYLQPGETSARNGTGKPEPVLTAQQWEDISKVAAAVTADDLRGVNAARGAHIVVNNHQRYIYDNRNDFGGAEITVVSQDPDEMGRRLTEKAVTARVTQTRGVRR